MNTRVRPTWRPRFVQALRIGAALAAALPAWALEQPPRWIKADDLRVRNAPALDAAVNGVLQRGTQVILKSPEPFDGFCLIQGDGLYGHVACQYLSAEPVARPRAGREGVPADWRWIAGTAVILRAGPSREAAVVSRLAVNRTVKLLKPDAGAGYCEVQPLHRTGQADGASGYTACQYLGLEPMLGAQIAGADADPVRAFWRAPDWWRLEAHAQTLTHALPEKVKSAGPWPRDAELERMKAHLALGLKGPRPGPLPDWAALKALAAAHDPAWLSAASREQARTGNDKELGRREYRASSAAQRLADALGLHGPLHDTISAEGGGERVLRLMRALELPTVQASLFRTEFEVGPPGEDAQQLAGRFEGIYRTRVTPRKLQKQQGEVSIGLYDMESRTVSLTRPVQRVQLYRDGSLSSQATFASTTENLWRDVDPPMCDGWEPGFAFGDVDGPIWNYFNEAGAASALPPKRARGPARLFAFHALQAPPRAKAARSEQLVKVERSETGFVRFTQMGFDIDGDGQLDLMLLEGVGSGPGHLGGPTETDDPWYRLLVANFGGAWKVLGRDTFGYGCGC